ncbi:ribokinase [Allomuricauda sp. SCSIO 65647]|uniref:ribokinase n=1 Tax=Allomuricauda sp. SCSIO 65647 TaxID=2908843 RepID=UPI001F1FB6C9|nr:ribokinase [Muricauda sp. SCSIO 65647]UJH67819.1 ribokinase [Muricauda sp. SCSIO 65647]
MTKITVIGSTNTDMVVKAGHIPRPGETVLGGKFFISLGGKGANQAVAASRMGGTVNFITKVGDDDMGKRAVQHFEEEGINTDYVFSEANTVSGVAMITLNEKGENSIVVAPGANESLAKKHIDKALEEVIGADIILIQLEIPLKTVEYAIALAKRHQRKVILNPAPAQKLSKKVLEGLYMITPNETETEILTGIKIVDEGSARAASNLLRECGVEVVIITMGDHGAFISSEEHTGLVSGKKVEALDTTAAGDTFNGALAVAIAAGKKVKEAVHFANCAAAISVTRLGAQASIPRLGEIEVGPI